jgi:hypothetical protein
MVAGRRLAMGSLDKVLRWFVEIIIAAVLLWLLMVVVISELELNSVISSLVLRP